MVEVCVDRDRRDRLGECLFVGTRLGGSAPRRANAAIISMARKTLASVVVEAMRCL